MPDIGPECWRATLQPVAEQQNSASWRELSVAGRQKNQSLRRGSEWRCGVTVPPPYLKSFLALRALKNIARNSAASAWNPDFKKVTPQKALEITEVEASGFVDDEEIDWDNLSKFAE